MKKIRIGIDADYFIGWGGGIEFIALIAEALEATGKVETFVLVPENGWFADRYNDLKCMIEARGSVKKAKAIKNSTKRLHEQLEYTFGVCTPGTKVLKYSCTSNMFIDNLEQKKEQCCIDNGFDILLPSGLCRSDKFAIPRVAYIADFQHKYLPDLFTEQECSLRDTMFGNQVNRSKYLIVNANTVKADIEKYYPQHACEVVVLPFKPFQIPKVSGVSDLSKYNLPEKYYIVCNQFWMHKNHMLAFDALEALYNKGVTDIHLVCTGLIDDHRNPKYGDMIKDKVNSLNCRENIHLVGFLPKDDQIEMMKNAIGLVQPTLFEGGPGGGATYNAICLGLPILLSDIPVNREVVGACSVDYFDPHDANQLADLMLAHAEDEKMPAEEVEHLIEENRREYGEILLNSLMEIIHQEK